MRIPQKLSPRVFVTTIAIVAVVAVIITVYQFVRGNNASQLARDSYGTKGHGYRAFLEILDELSLESRRTISPPVRSNSIAKTIVLLEPNPQIMATEQKFVGELKGWIEKGGTLLYSPQLMRYSNGGELVVAPPEGFAGLLPKLGIEGIQFEMKDSSGDTKIIEPKEIESTTEKITAEIQRVFQDRTKDQMTVSASFDGELERLASHAKNLQVYSNEIITILPKDGMEVGSVSIDLIDPGNENKTSSHKVIVSVPLGQGKIYIMSMPCLAENRMIAQQDNSPLLIHLVGTNATVELDEFFHGHYVKGNIIYLLTRPMYATVFLLLLVAFVLWTMRQSHFLGPVLDPPQTSRRSIKEYISAMGQFLASGRDSPHFLLLELRSGLIFSLADEFGMYEGVSDPGILFDQIEKRNPKIANYYRKMINDIEKLLASPNTINRKSVNSIVKEFRLVSETKL